MRFQIIPKQGVSGIAFGISSSEVRSRFSSRCVSFYRSPNSARPCDSFPEEGIFCYYDMNGALEAIEFATPSEPWFEGYNLLDISFDDVLTLFAQYDPNLIIDDTGFISHSACVGIYAPQHEDDPNTLTESIIVFRAGYYR